MRASFSPHPCQYLLFFVPFKIAILTEARGNLYVILIYISFMVRDVKHFFVLLAICTSSFEKGMFSLFAYFFIR
jgi:hypothetical protein